MKKAFTIIAMSALLFFVLGCDKIDINNTHKPYTSLVGVKTILVKDFTGARCTNCPAAAEVAHELQHLIGEDQLFILSVHAGFQAQPQGHFPDYQTEEGTIWYGDHDVNPLFSVDHVALTDGQALSVDRIDAAVAEMLGEPQTFDVSVINEYDESSRQLKVKTSVEAVSDAEGEFYVSVCLVEDSIVGWQAFPGNQINKEYVFRNVFRGLLNGFDGELFNKGQTYVYDAKDFEKTLELDTIYNADQCYIMSYIYDKTDGKIMQTAMEKIK